MFSSSGAVILNASSTYCALPPTLEAQPRTIGATGSSRSNTSSVTSSFGGEDAEVLPLLTQADRSNVDSTSNMKATTVLRTIILPSALYFSFEGNYNIFCDAAEAIPAASFR